MMAKNIETLAKRLGASIEGTVPDYSPGAFGMSALANLLRDRLEPSAGKRPGRPSNPEWSKRPKVPMAPETEQRLKELASLLSEGERRVSPMQVAAFLLEQATASYFQMAVPALRKRQG
jgi:hypothetical protein